MATKGPNLITMAEAATEWGVHERTIRRRISDGTLSAWRLPGTRGIRVNAEELHALLQPIPSASRSF